MLDVEEPYWGIIFKPWQDIPVAHRMRRTDEPGWFTACGRRVGLSTPMFPWKHVKKFARPCKGCFPSD